MLDRNWRCEAGELDLVLTKAGLIVFCEVKARRNADYGPAAAAVDTRKQRTLRTLAVQWLKAHPGRHDGIRFDVAAVTGTTVEVIHSAF